MFEKIKKIMFDRERSEEEYKIVIQVLEKTNLYVLPPEGTDVREFDYQQLKKLPGVMWKFQEENEALMQEVRTYKENTENVSSVIDTILDTVEKRYGIKGNGEASES